MSAITKPEYWLGSLGIIIIISMALLFFGNSVTEDTSITLDEDSTNYLKTYTKEINDSGIKTRAEDEIENKDTQNPLLKWLSGNNLIADVFGLFTIVANAISGVWDFFTMAFNLPSFFINTLGISTLGSLKYIINTLGTILFLSIIILLVRIAK